MKLVLCCFILAFLAKDVVGHGMMLEPPNRSSMWRFNITGSITDYDDDQNYCGGLTVSNAC